MTVCGDAAAPPTATWRERTRRLANFLADRGFGAHRERDELDNWECGQDRVALIMHNDLYPEMVDRLPQGAHRPGQRQPPLHAARGRRPAGLRQAPGGHLPPCAGGEVRRRAAAAGAADLLISVDDGSDAPHLPGAVTLEDALAQGDPERRIAASPDDLIMFCTGGTTGRPKGVLWRQSDIYVSSMVGADHESAGEIHDKVRATTGPPWFAVSPLMHAAGLWTVFSGLLAGCRGAVRRPDRSSIRAPCWQTAEREKVGLMTMVGDAYAAPLIEELGRRQLRPVVAVRHRNRRRRDQSQTSSACWRTCRSSPSSTATGPRRPGTWASGTTSAGRTARPSTCAKAGLVVSDDCTRFLEPGDAEVGWVARTGRIPLGYFDDADATRKTFPVVDGQRVVVSGDRASLEADGTLRLFGRDSLVVNTGGEKVFVEEVEAVLRAHPGVADALVVGRDSERWGQEIVALVATAPGRCRRRRDALHAALHRAAGAVQGAQGVHLRRQGSPARQRQGRLPVGEERSHRDSGDDGDGSDHDAQSDRLSGQRALRRDRPSSPTSCSRCATTTSRARSRCTNRSSCPTLLDEMDEHGVEKAILMDNLVKPSVTARKFVEAAPGPVRAGDGRGQPAAARPVAARTRRHRQTTCRSRMPLSGRASGATACIRPATPCTTRSTPSAPSSNCRCASTPGCPVRRSRARCRTRSTSTGCASGSPS